MCAYRTTLRCYRACLSVRAVEHATASPPIRPLRLRSRFRQTSCVTNDVRCTRTVRFQIGYACRVVWCCVACVTLSLSTATRNKCRIICAFACYFLVRCVLCVCAINIRTLAHMAHGTAPLAARSRLIERSHLCAVGQHIAASHTYLTASLPSGPSTSVVRLHSHRCMFINTNSS